MFTEQRSEELGMICRYQDNFHDMRPGFKLSKFSFKSDNPSRQFEILLLQAKILLVKLQQRFLELEYFLFRLRKRRFLRHRRHLIHVEIRRKQSRR